MNSITLHRRSGRVVVAVLSFFGLADTTSAAVPAHAGRHLGAGRGPVFHGGPGHNSALFSKEAVESRSAPLFFQDAAIAEAVQRVEETGPLDDAQAMREAMALDADGGGQIVERARLLGQRIGLQDELARARAWAPGSCWPWSP